MNAHRELRLVCRSKPRVDHTSELHDAQYQTVAFDGRVWVIVEL